MKSLLILVLASSIFFQANSQKIHLLQLVDEADKKFSLVTQKGEDHMAKVFETIDSIMNYGGVKYKTLTNSQFNFEALNEEINAMKVAPNDIVVFYYSGFGTYPANSNSKYPFLQLNDSDDNPTSFDSVCDKIAKKNARLTIAIADCRNFRLKLEIPTKPKTYGRNTGKVKDVRPLIVSNLLKTTSGIVKIASQQDGGVSNVIKRIRFERETPQGEYVLKIDENEYSVFSVSFADMFERLLTQRNTYLEFPNLFNAIQYRINWELNPTDNTKREQTLEWDITYKGKTDLSKEGWDKLPANNETFEIKLNQLLDIKDKNTRKQFCENMIIKFQNTDLTIFTHSIFEPEKNINENKKKYESTSVAEYLERLENYRPIINSIRIESIKIENKKTDDSKPKIIKTENRRTILETLFADNKNEIIMEEFYND